MKVDRRFRNGFMLTNSYTLSRSYDYVNENGTVSTPIDFEQSWARSNFDRLHNYTLTGLYELPWGPNKRWLKEGLLGKLIGGWQLSGLFVAQSGVPLSITGNGTMLNTPGTTAYANLNGDNNVLGGLGQGNLYFDPSVYSQPAAGVQGNMKRNTGLRGRASGSSTARSSSGSRSRRPRYAEFRVDAYNVTNSVRWGNPNTSSAPPPATPSARSPAPPAASAACGSARGLCSNHAASFPLPASRLDRLSGRELEAGRWAPSHVASSCRRHELGSWKREANA